MVHIEEVFDDDDMVTGPGESLKAATGDKDLGNKYFKEGDYAGAIQQYTNAVQRLEPHSQHPGALGRDLQSVLVASLANRAAARLKLERYGQAVEDCTQVLCLQSKHTKAVFRRAQAYEALANGHAADMATFQDYVGRAMEDVKTLVVLEPTCKDHKAWHQRLKGMLEGAADPAPVANGGGCDGSGATGTAEEEAAAAPPQPAPHSELTTCELCRIANGHLTARKVYEDKLFVALADPQGDAAHHYVVLPRAHLPPVDKLLPRHLPVVQHLLVVANRVLRDAGADTLDVLLGFHQPPFVSGCHLYLTALSPRSGMRMWASNVRYSRMVFTPVHAAIAHLEAMA